jgi:hypothetical protein
LAAADQQRDSHDQWHTVAINYDIPALGPIHEAYVKHGDRWVLSG